MGRWTTRYAEKLAAPPEDGTDKTAKRGVLSVLAVTPQEGPGVFSAVPVAPTAPTATAHHLAQVAWTDGDNARFFDRRARLLRWRWPEAEAERWAARLVRRDREADPRVSCAECCHYRPGQCSNHRRAGLLKPDVARDLASLLQRCDGFNPSS